MVTRTDEKLKQAMLPIRLFLALCFSTSTALPLQLTSEEVVLAVESVGMTVADMDRSLEFYSSVLSFERVSDIEVWGDEYDQLQGIFGLRMRVVRMKLGGEFIELAEYLTPRGRPIPADSRSNDQWFQHIAIVVSDMQKAYQHLRTHEVQHVSTAPQRLPDWNKAAAGIKAFYFRDLDGHNLEIIYYPSGKGDSKWHHQSEMLFLGIDHTAIVVSNTQASLKFYKDLLGLKLVGKSENYGREQELLNHVFGARLRISSLRAPTGPGVEFLEYLTPRDGRPMPVDVRPNDLMHWKTTLVIRDAGNTAHRLRLSKATFVSSSVVTVPDGELDFKKGFLVRDPDGHALQFIEK